MKYLKILICIFLLAPSARTRAASFSKGDGDKIKWTERHLFLTTGASFLYLNRMQSPKYIFDPCGKYFDTIKCMDKGVKAIYRVNQMSIFSFVFAPRLNLFDFKDKASISLDMPIEFGIVRNALDLTKTDSTGTKETSRFTRGGFSLKLPVLLSFNSGFHSTFNNIDHIGHSFGFGAQLVLRSIRKPSKDGNEDVGEVPQYWIQPVISYTLKTDNEESHFDGVQLQVGFLNGWSYRLNVVFIIGY